MGSTTELDLLQEISYELPEVIDSTIITSYRSCDQKMFLTHMQHLRGGDEHIALIAGSTFAAGLEAYRWHAFTNHQQPNDAFDFAFQAMVLRWGDYVQTNPKDARTFDKVAYAIWQYFKRWPTWADPIRPHFRGPRENPTFEFSFAVELPEEKGFPLHPSGHPFLYAGRFDLLGEYADAKLPVVEDDKTTIRLGASWAEQWEIRHQFLGYIWGLRELGYPHRHVMVRGIGLKKEIEIVETPPIKVTDDMLLKFEASLKTTLWDMVKRTEKAKRERTLFPRQFGDACNAFMRPCVFKPICGSSLQNEVRFMKTMRREKWDPLGTDRIVDQVRTFPREINHPSPLQTVTLEEV